MPLSVVQALIANLNFEHFYCFVCFREIPLLTPIFICSAHSLPLGVVVLGNC